MLGSYNLDSPPSIRDFNCNSCQCNKSKKIAILWNISCVNQTAWINFFWCLGGPNIQSIDGYHYYVIFVDHYTRFSWIFLLKRKSEVVDIFKTFRSFVEKQFNNVILTLNLDNGDECLTLKSYLANNGIKHLTTPPHTPENNEIFEKKHKHVEWVLLFYVKPNYLLHFGIMHFKQPHFLLTVCLFPCKKISHHMNLFLTEHQIIKNLNLLVVYATHG